MSTSFSVAVSAEPLNVYTPYSIYRIVGLIWVNDGTFIKNIWCFVKNEYGTRRRKQECEMSLESAFRADKDKVLDYIWDCKVPKAYWERAWNAVFDEQQLDL